MVDWSTIEYFTPDEFDSPDEPRSGYRMHRLLVENLDDMRSERGRSIVINSGYRTEEHNKEVGGSPSSSHLTGHAADVKAMSSTEKYELVTLALKHGINRIGIGKSFIHFDVDYNKPQHVIWVY